MIPVSCDTPVNEEFKERDGILFCSYTQIGAVPGAHYESERIQTLLTVYIAAKTCRSPLVRENASARATDVVSGKLFFKPCLGKLWSRGCRHRQVCDASFT